MYDVDMPSCTWLWNKELNFDEKTGSSFVWHENTPSFTKLILSWSASRADDLLIEISLLVHEWSAFIPYALWKKEEQRTYKHQANTLPFVVDQDTIILLNGMVGRGFKVRVTGKSLLELRALHASAIHSDGYEMNSALPVKSASLKVPGRSQMALESEKGSRLCSPTSVTSVMSYLTSTDICPLNFSRSVLDASFDIYGNWALNTAAASAYLGSQWRCFPCFCDRFQTIFDNLRKGIPSVISIVGPLEGAPLPYASGHLLVVCGYNAQEKSILCMDPAFSNDLSTHVAYPFASLLQAWKKREGLAYLFTPSG